MFILPLVSISSSKLRPRHYCCSFLLLCMYIAGVRPPFQCRQHRPSHILSLWQPQSGTQWLHIRRSILVVCRQQWPPHQSTNHHKPVRIFQKNLPQKHLPDPQQCYFHQHAAQHSLVKGFKSSRSNSHYCWKGVKKINGK